MTRSTPRMRAAALCAAGLLAAAGLQAAQGQQEAQGQSVPNAGAEIGAAVAATHVAKIRVAAGDAALFADGRSVLHFTVSLLDADGSAVNRGVVAVSSDGGVLLDDAGDAAVGGLPALWFRDGKAIFSLRAPALPGDVHVRVASGDAVANGTLNFLPELRDMVAVGVVEGVISRHGVSAGSIAPTGFADGFEQEIQRWSRQLGDNVDAAGRAAFFLKGKIGGDALLTAAYDSDKDTRAKLAATIDPNAVYPVYGDNAIVGFEAQSASRLYVRIDKDRSWLLYGDFSTAGLTPAPSPLSLQTTTLADGVLLGRYNRSATGLRGHLENPVDRLDAFVIDDTLKQVVEEYPANGTSGPFAVRNGNAVQNSERVEVIVRDRNQRGVVISVTPLVRYVDYSFEPFSGRILLSQPLASLSPAGDPLSLRITYEVDQGGARFLTYGVSASRLFAGDVRLGAADVEDRNPLAPYRLSSASADVALSENLRLVLEAAQTQSTTYDVNGANYALPSGQAGELDLQHAGDAGRAELVYKGAHAEGRLWWVRAATGFDNPNSGLAPGREETGARGDVPIADGTRAYADTLHSTDALTQTGRQSSRIGAERQITPAWAVDLSVHRIHDDSAFPADATVAPNAAPPGAGGTVAGGFYGSGTSTTVIDPLTGAAINTLTPTGAAVAPTAGQALDATTVRLGSAWRATQRLSLDGAVEKSIDGDDRSSAEIGGTYSTGEREKAYVRAETQTGLASANSLLPADRSNALIAGFTEGVSEETSAFTEYRLVDAQSASTPWTSDRILANGLKNVHGVAPGIAVTTTAEVMRVLEGSQRQAVATTARVDYTALPDWKSSVGLEFRRLNDDHRLPGNQAQDQWLSTIATARRLDADWTFLGKNYFLFQRNRDDAAGNPTGDLRQERILVGLAWRPRQNNRINALARYEFKTVSDQSQPLGERGNAHIASVSADWHPSPAWWATSRVAAKRATDFTLPQGGQSYDAWLLGGRIAYDLSQRVDLGVLVSTLRQQAGIATQNAYGVESGYRVATNLWVSVGFNLSGFTDRDLAASDYTARGVYLRLRAKFDETAFRR